MTYVFEIKEISTAEKHIDNSKKLSYHKYSQVDMSLIEP